LNVTGDTNLSVDTDSFALAWKSAGEQAEATEKNRKLAPELARDLADAGMFKLFVPAEIGGLELGPVEGNRLIYELATHDASSAWVSMIGSTAALGAAFIAPDISADMFAAPSRITCGIFAPNGRAVQDGDTYRVSGRWAWASGSANADYIGLGCLEVDATGAPVPERPPRLVMVPREQIRFHDTWHTIGLCGTSSGDVELDNVEIPVAHSYTIAAQKPWCESALYKMPYFGFLATGVAAVALGNAKSALQDIYDLALNKTPAGHSRALAEKSAVQSALAEAEAQLRSADALYWQVLDNVWQRVTNAADITPEARADLRLISTFAVRTCLQVVRTAHDIAGGTSVYKNHPLQRRLRDAETMSQHMITNASTFELVGRVRLGGFHPKMQL
jgi:alkylation response protein AidB-like acyl-CoA dehydrogenase